MKNELAVILKHLVPALDRARVELERQEACAAESARGPRIMSPGEAAEYLEISESQLRILTDRGAIPCKRLSDRIVRYSERSLLEYIEDSPTGRPALQRGSARGVVA